MNLENMEILTLQRPRIGACGFLSVNVEDTNRAGFCGLGRKNHLNNLRYLRGRWKTHRAATRLASRAALTTKEGSIPDGY